MHSFWILLSLHAGGLHDINHIINQTNHSLLQLVAWNIHQDLAIHDVLDHHILLLQGQCPWTTQASSLPTIHIAYRRHQQHHCYDANYNPLHLLEGHYWAIVKIAQRQQCRPFPPNDNPFAVLAVDDVEMTDALSARPRGNGGTTSVLATHDEEMTDAVSASTRGNGSTSVSPRH